MSVAYWKTACGYAYFMHNAHVISYDVYVPFVLGAALFAIILTIANSCSMNVAAVLCITSYTVFVYIHQVLGG